MTDVSTTLAVVIFRVKEKTTAKVVETSVNINTKNPSQDYINLGDLHLQTCNVTPGFKSFTLLKKAVADKIYFHIVNKKYDI